MQQNHSDPQTYAIIGTAIEVHIINYLKATNYSRGLLLNFGTESLEYKRSTNNWKK